MADYDLVVIGGGATGLAAARASRGKGRRIAMVEVERPGGDCTFYGCVPSKALIETARRVHGARQGARYGFKATVRVDFPAVMARVHAVIEEIAQDESPELLKSEGIELLTGHARFVGPDAVEVDGRRVTADRFVIATGANAFVPPIPGLADVAHLTNRTLFSLDALPKHLLVLGGGAIGIEQAQGFARLGSKVTVVEGLPRILPKEEPEASAVITEVLRREGVDVRTGVSVESASAGAAGPVLHLADGSTVTGTHLLVAVGRRPNTSSLDLEAAGVATTKTGAVVVDDTLRTANERIYAAGDCATPLQFTHVGDEQGRLAARNAFARRGKKWDARVMPWVTFTEPEVAHVGLTEAEAYAAHGAKAKVCYLPMSRVDRARSAAETDGFVKVVVGPRGPISTPVLGQILGATIVAGPAGEMLGELTLAMVTRSLAARPLQAVHPYPAWSVGVRQALAQLLGSTSHSGDAMRPARPDAS